MAEEQKKASAKEVLADIRAGATDEFLMKKYGVSEKGLQSLFQKLINAKVLTQVDLDRRTVEEVEAVIIEEDEDKPVPPAATSTQTVFRCPACNMPQSKEFEVCPQCGVIVQKYQKTLPYQVVPKGEDKSSEYAKKPEQISQYYDSTLWVDWSIKLANLIRKTKKVSFRSWLIVISVLVGIVILLGFYIKDVAHNKDKQAALQKQQEEETYKRKQEAIWKHQEEFQRAAEEKTRRQIQCRESLASQQNNLARVRDRIAMISRLKREAHQNWSTAIHKELEIVQMPAGQYSMDKSNVDNERRRLHSTGDRLDSEITAYNNELRQLAIAEENCLVSIRATQASCKDHLR